MGQKKLIRFAEIDEMKNVLQLPDNIKGNWKEHFKNDNSITLELACGKGEYTVGLAKMYPNRNFIGVDIKGNRIWKGAKIALEQELENVAFLRIDIDQIEKYFAKNEVSEIWITFPDPQLRWSKMKKRLTHPKFLRKYQQFLKEDGVVHLKTDSPNLYQFTKAVIEMNDLELLSDYDHLYESKDIARELTIKTHYEGLDIAQSNRIHYLAFKLNTTFDPERDAALKEMFREQ